MEHTIQENGKEIYGTATANRFGPTERSTKDTGPTTWHQEKEYLHSLLEMYMKVSGPMIKQKDMASTDFPTEMCTQDSSRITCQTVRELCAMQTSRYTKENG